MTKALINPGNSQMAVAWDKYMNENVVDLAVVNKTVVDSWNRCKALKVDPYENNTDGIFGSELSQRIKQREHLINIARPFMYNLYNFVKGSGFQVVLSDEHGILLEVLGDPEILEQTKGVFLLPGGDWSEQKRGTNAVGTAIMEQKPVQIYGREHFCRANHFLTCSAAPIYDPEGQLLGVLDVSGDHRKANPHTLGMVVAAVYAIESQLRLHKATKKLYMAYKYSNTIVESISEGLVSVDSNGYVTHLNGIGSEILGIDLNESKGKSIEELVKTKLPMLDVLRTGKGYTNQEIMYENESGRKHFTSTTTPIFNEKGEVIGVTATLRKMKTVQQLASKFSGVQAAFTFDHIIGQSSAIRDAINMAKLAAGSVSTVLLNGESGTGKELFAQAIHNASSRAAGPFVAINCGALPRDLIESELFGYDEGAFTGARKGGHLGKFELASGGTIFLDEIGDMPLEIQVTLLRVLQERRITRLGGQKTIPVDVRIIAATNRNLEQLVEEGRFRADLFYRLNVMSITIPPLRDRAEDVILITQNLVIKISKMLKRRVVRISTQFMQAVKNYSWPGNVRQLENVLERSINIVEEGVLVLEHLPEEIRPELDTDIKQKKDKQEEPCEILPLWIIEKNAIEQALHQSGGKIIRAAKALGIGRNTLYRKIKEYGINTEVS